MVYLSKIVIFHGELLNNQMVIPNIMIIMDNNHQL